MKNKTFRSIIILVALLFINIEAAQAGLILRFKAYIRNELSDFQIVYALLALLALSFISYVIFTPVLIGKEKWGFLTYYSYNPTTRSYQNKRMLVRKISGILKNDKPSDHIHS
ncbi:MAG: hypothetical protein JNL60_05945 [Bacteroidia bacterium]|nr:hypothetical protein [Bacteroidia bacterium]